MDWSRAKCLKLIEQYERHPVLWDPNDGLYYNRAKKCDAWTEIDYFMGCGSGEAKKKMESVLASFRREKAKLKTCAEKGNRETYVSKWFAFKRLAFLLDKDEPRRTISSVPEGEIRKCRLSEEEDTSDEHEPSDEQYIVAQSSSQTFSQKTCKANSSANPKMTEKRRQTSEIVDESEFEEAFRILKKAISNKGDECGVYGQHVANKLRNYSKRTRDIVQHHINTILFNADMGQYDTEQTTGSISNSCLPHRASTPLSQAQTMTMSDSEEEATPYDDERS